MTSRSRDVVDLPQLKRPTFFTRQVRLELRQPDLPLTLALPSGELLGGAFRGIRALTRTGCCARLRGRCAKRCVDL